MEMKYNDVIYIVTNNSGDHSILTKDELSSWIKDGSIQPGFDVIEVIVSNVYKAKSTIELKSTIVS